MRKPKRVPRETYSVDGEEIKVDEVQIDDFILFGSPGERKPGSNFRQWTLGRVLKITKANWIVVELWNTWTDDQGNTHHGARPLYYAKEGLEAYKLYRIGKWKKEKSTSGI